MNKWQRLFINPLTEPFINSLRDSLISPLVFLALLGVSLNYSSAPSEALADNQAKSQEQELTVKSRFESKFTRRLRENFLATKSDGCLILFDLKRQRYIRYNRQHCEQRFLPASTFKIFNSLVALQTGVIANENVVFKWDGITREFPLWNQDQTLRTAFSRSVVWVYQDLARRIGNERMAQYIKAVGYGNGDISGGIDTFWLNGKLRIAPEEQIQFLVGLYQEELPFTVPVMRTVKEVMIIERTSEYTLRGKTGWGRNVDGAESVGWYVGYLEKSDDVYFYALNLTTQEKDFDMISIRKKMLYDAFRDLSLL
ncbi:MAG: class D beta-lactamase [Pseudanabaenaceae cyanobacterium]